VTRILSYACFAALVACAPPSINTTFVVPAHDADAAKLRRVGVYPFDGRNGEIYRARIEALLTGITLNGKQYFTMVERARLDAVLSEQKTTGEPLFDEHTAAQVGRLAGAEGIYMGVVNHESVSDDRYSRTRQRCASTDKDGKCTRWRDETIPCTRRVASVAMTLRLVATDTGTIVFARELSGRDQSDACRGDGKPLRDRNSLLAMSRQRAVDSLRQEIAPYLVTREIELMDETDGIEDRKAREKLESGLEFAEAGRMDRACEFWAQGRGLAPRALSLIYNLGVCAELDGDLEMARALYADADRLLRRPDPRVNAALTRVDKRLEERSDD